ncbi:MAG: bacillithiol transferase BstA [Schleiferiaceae bacterium]
MTSLDALKFPIGKWKRPEDFDLVQALQDVLTIARLPQNLDDWVESAEDGDIEKTYRPEGWTGAQVINHLADSHMNAFVRSKLTMTEDKPSILPYLEAAWAELPDGKTVDVSASLSLINGLHARWVLFFESLQPEDWKRQYYHPESKADFALYEVASLYAWHSEHHYNHLLLIHNPS